MNYDYVIIGSGFGGSVCALRLVEKGYKVLLIERGRRFAPSDFAKSNLNIKKFLWFPLLRCFGMTELSLFSHVLVQHGCGFGGGSLGYANVLLEPEPDIMATTQFGKIIPWKEIMSPFFQKARQMLGAQVNPIVWPADKIFQQVSQELKCESTFTRPQVAVFLGEPGKEVSDPYFNGKGPNRVGCTHCGGCMIGCRIGAKNTLDKNYLYLAEKLGLEVRIDTKVTGISLYEKNNTQENSNSRAPRYSVQFKSSINYFAVKQNVLAQNVVVAAGVLGTLKLLFHCRDIAKTLPNISQKLGHFVRTNGEALLSSTRFDKKIDHTQGISITSSIQPDKFTQAQLVHFPRGSSLVQWLSVPLIYHTTNSFLMRIFLFIFAILKAPWQFMRIKFFPNWATRSALFLIMQANNSSSGALRFKLKRRILKFFQYALVSETYTNIPPPPATTKVAHTIANAFAKQNNAGVHVSFTEGILNTPTTAHILGGCPMGINDNEGVIAKNCEVFNYPGLFVIDGSIVTEDLGVNPALTITALAEFSMSLVKEKLHE